MRRICNYLFVFTLLMLLGACSVRTMDESAGVNGVSQGDTDNPLLVGGGSESDDLPSGGGSEGLVTPENPPPAAPQYDPLEIVTAKLNDCYQGLDYYHEMEANGGSEHYEWGTITGQPDGLSGSHYISGTTTVAPGVYSVTVTLTDTKTNESVTKQLPLKVVEFIKEDVKIRVSQFVNGEWKAFVENDHIENAVLSSDVRRFRLEVIKDDEGGSPASASRFHWSVKSSPAEMWGVYVPPAIDVGDEYKEGQIAYLVPGLWGTVELNAVALAESGENISADVSVRDDFGNSAHMTFSDLQLLKRLEIAVVKDNNTANDNITKYDFVAAKDNWTATNLKATGGLAPYKWNWLVTAGNSEEGSQPSKEMEGPGFIRAKGTIKCSSNSDGDCDEAYVLWEDIKITGVKHDPGPDAVVTPPDPSKLLLKTKVKVTDARGEMAVAQIGLRDPWPMSPMRDTNFSARVSVVEACNTSAATHLKFNFIQPDPPPQPPPPPPPCGPKDPGYPTCDPEQPSEPVQSTPVLVATADFELDPVPCDPDETSGDGDPITFLMNTGIVNTEDGVNVPTSNGNWQKEAQFGDYPLNAGMWYANEIDELTDPNQTTVEVHTTAPGDENGALELDVIHVWFTSTHWFNEWEDGRGGTMGAPTGDFHLDVTGLFTGWQPLWSSVPADRRTF